MRREQSTGIQNGSGEKSEQCLNLSQYAEKKGNASIADTVKGCDYSEFSNDEVHWSSWPILDNSALDGFAGKFVRMASKNSEADPAAILATFLTRFAVEIGNKPRLMVGDAFHNVRLFTVIVGSSAKARKGTSAKPVERLFKFNIGLPGDIPGTQKPYKFARSTPGPLSTGEGIIDAVRDEKKEWNAKEASYAVTDPGVHDKRLYVMDEEFASALSCTKREGNTLSAILRCLHDRGTVEPLTKTSKLKTTNAHIGICTHITNAELHKKLTETEALNGFGNRFLWVCAKRSKILPFPKPIPTDALKALQSELIDIILASKQIGLMRMSEDAKEVWQKAYLDLSRDRDGLSGTVCNRAEAQTLRLAMIYALLDRSDAILPSHLESALAFWRYCENSARFIFAQQESDPKKNRIIAALKQGPRTTTELHKLFCGHLRKDELNKILRELQINARIEIEKVKTKGKPRTLFKLARIPSGMRQLKL